jgi:hypothetical protein
VVQERDKIGLALVAMNRVVRERSLQEVLFPGRDPATSANRTWELARDVYPVGPYWQVQQRMKDDGALERYLHLTEAGYGQARSVHGVPHFARMPTAALKPSHVLHDLDLADFMLGLLPRVEEEYVPKRHGKVVGPVARILVPRLPKNWRWVHHSVYRPIAAYEGRRDSAGRPVERPRLLLSYEPDAIIETDTLNETRYFVEWDRGTEPIAGKRERRTIEDKLQRTFSLVWSPWDKDGGARMWHQRDSLYCRIFSGSAMRRPKVVIITRSPVRASNILQAAREYFGRVAPGLDVADFFEVGTVSQIAEKFRSVLARVERAAPAAERPWEVHARHLAEARAREAKEAARVAAAEAAQKAAAKAKADAEAARDRRERAAVIANSATRKSPRRQHCLLPEEEWAKLPPDERRAVSRYTHALREERRTIDEMQWDWKVMKAREREAWLDSCRPKGPFAAIRRMADRIMGGEG